ncbi:MAG: hypothetical protein ABI706_01370 [Ilumatobacteraceae bacterium]
MKVVRRCVLIVVLLAAVAGCGSQPRDEARDSLVKQLQDGGLDAKTAECVVAAFFDGKTNEELKGFFDRPELTSEEAAEFAVLGQRCKAESGG